MNVVAIEIAWRNPKQNLVRYVLIAKSRALSSQYWTDQFPCSLHFNFRQSFHPENTYCLRHHGHDVLSARHELRALRQKILNDSFGPPSVQTTPTSATIRLPREHCFSTELRHLRILDAQIRITQCYRYLASRIVGYCLLRNAKHWIAALDFQA